MSAATCSSSALSPLRRSSSLASSVLFFSREALAFSTAATALAPTLLPAAWPSVWRRSISSLSSPSSLLTCCATSSSFAPSNLTALSFVSYSSASATFRLSKTRNSPNIATRAVRALLQARSAASWAGLPSNGTARRLETSCAPSHSCASASMVAFSWAGASSVPRLTFLNSSISAADSLQRRLASVHWTTYMAWRAVVSCDTGCLTAGLYSVGRKSPQRTLTELLAMVP